MDKNIVSFVQSPKRGYYPEHGMIHGLLVDEGGV